MTDTCARCGLPFSEGERRWPIFMDGSGIVHRDFDCISRLTAVARAAEAVCSSHETYGEMERDRDRLRDALRGACGGDRP